MNLIKLRLNDWSVIALIFIAVVIIAVNFHSRRWEKHLIIDSDAKVYYGYLPAFFIEKDISLSFWDKDRGMYSQNYWPIRTKDNKFVFKMSLGLSYLYAPFFFMADFYTRNFSFFNADGFTRPYHFFILLSSIFYTILGLVFLRKILLKFYSSTVTALTLISVALGTNLYYYVYYQPAFSHSYNFALIIIFIFLTIKWHEKPNFKYSVLIGLIAGLITLIRPNNVIFTMFFIFFNVTSLEKFKQSILLFLKNYKLIIVILLGIFIIWLPQFLYWNYLTGNFFYYSYGHERFFFDNPKIIEGLFSFRKGWIIYTPVMFFAIIGIFMMLFKREKYSFIIFLITCLFIYIALSWWCWWYGGSFGMRAFIDMYGLLSIPLAYFINYCYQKKAKTFKILCVKIILFFVFLNVFQAWQVENGCMSCDSNTFKYYKCIFLKTKDCYKCNSYLISPNYENALKYGKE